jgi:propionate CoA-transferase
MKSRIDRLLCSPDHAASLVADSQTVACGGFVGAAHPEALTAAIERRFHSGGGPQNLTLVYGAGQGDGKSRGLNHLAHDGLVRRVIGGHWGLVPGLGRLANAGNIEAYNFPQGVICQLLRDIAAGRPGCITHVGLGTFIDPVNGGGRLNDSTTDELVSRVDLDGKTWLFYRAFPIHVGLIRATAADPFGNLVMDEEAVIGEVLPIAQAAHNCGGKVIAQVKRLLDRPAPPNQVKVPGVLVDNVVIADEAEHPQTFGESLNEAYFSPQTDNELPGGGQPEKMAPGVRRIIAARACDELLPGAIANLGIGIPEGVGLIAAERDILDQITLTLESGPIGGIPAGGLSFGASAWPEAIIDQPAQFDFYDGGGLDYAALGAAQVDQYGNVNVSKFHDRVAGVGGFVNISQNARRVVFCGTLTSGGLEVDVADGELRILKEGSIRKFVPQVEQVSFSGRVAVESGREILYVTERAVFQLTPKGLRLTEVAPGIDIQTQILNLIDFAPIVESVRPMDASCFA